MASLLPALCPTPFCQLRPLWGKERFGQHPCYPMGTNSVARWSDSLKKGKENWPGGEPQAPRCTDVYPER